MQGNAGFVAETRHEFLKGRLQGLLKGSPTILLHSLLSDEKRHQFSLADGDQRKLSYRSCVRKAMPCAVVFERQHKLIPHEVHIALNRLR